MPVSATQKRQLQCPPSLSMMAAKRTFVTLIAITALALFGAGFLSYLQTSHPSLIGRLWHIKESTAFMMIGLGVVLGVGTLDILRSRKENPSKKGEETPKAPPSTPLLTPQKVYEKMMNEELKKALQQNDQTLMAIGGSPPPKATLPPATTPPMMSPDPCGDIHRLGPQSPTPLIL